MGESMFIPPVEPQMPTPLLGELPIPTTLPAVELQKSEFVPHVVVKFSGDAKEPYSDDAVQKFLETTLSSFADKYGPITLRRLFRSITAKTEGYNHEKTYFMIDLHKDIWRELYQSKIDISKEQYQSSNEQFQPLINELKELPGVEIAYLDVMGEGPTVNPNDPCFTNQDHLNPNLGGIPIQTFWNNPGGDGEGMAFIDIEQGWNLDHEDLKHLPISTVGMGINTLAAQDHGTLALGVVCGRDNELGILGIAPKLRSIGVASYVQQVPSPKFSAAWTHNIADAIFEARNNLACGDVILLEIQVIGSEVPIEVIPTVVAGNPTLYAIFDQIVRATSAGRIVIEPAGNRKRNLDSDPNTTMLTAGKPLSGAIMVGAVEPGPVPTRWNNSNYGNRVDCCAWGENVLSSSINPNRDTSYNPFNGTSSAAAIIAGMALVIQGIRKKIPLNPLNATDMRDLLRDLTNGTDLSGEGIRVLPDLTKLVNNMPQAGGC